LQSERKSKSSTFIALTFHYTYIPNINNLRSVQSDKCLIKLFKSWKLSSRERGVYHIRCFLKRDASILTKLTAVSIREKAFIREWAFIGSFIIFMQRRIRSLYGELFSCEVLLQQLRNVFFSSFLAVLSNHHLPL
jgi:hypothetical protein